GWRAVAGRDRTGPARHRGVAAAVVDAHARPFLHLPRGDPGRASRHRHRPLPLRALRGGQGAAGPGAMVGPHAGRLAPVTGSMIVKRSASGHVDTVSRLAEAIDQRNLTTFARIDPA